MVSLAIRGKTKIGWVMFDTGARTSIINSADASKSYRVFTELAGIIGLDDAVRPKLSIANYQLSGFEYKVRDMGGDGFHMILGSDLLKRFNLIFDNKNGYLYMQPNSLTNVPYGKPDEYYIVRITLALLTLIGLIVLFMKIRKKKTQSLI